MKRTKIILAFVLILSFSCKKEPQIIQEPWVNKPISQWPDFALTNDISFDDTTYTGIANSFLINTGFDTIGVSCKHLFMVFGGRIGLNSIDLGSKFEYWKLYPKSDKEKAVSIKRLINSDPKEEIGQFNTLKVRDWIIFEISERPTGLYPLKIRFTPVKSNEIVYAVGWGSEQKNNSYPVLIKQQYFKGLGDYYYTKTLDKEISPHGRSGSPVIDKNGYLVGIVSGAEGNLSVVGSVYYLKKLFDKYNIKYEDPYD